MAKLVSMGMSIPGLEISIHYNPANLRVTTLDWSLPQSGVAARARIWRDGGLALDRTIAGPASGTVTIPPVPGGVLRVRQVTEDGQTFYDLPEGITYQINVETIG